MTKYKKLIKYIKDNFNKDEYEKIFLTLINEFKHQLGFKISLIMMQLTYTSFRDLEGDFKLLRKSSSSVITINKKFSKQELNKSRNCGVGYLEHNDMKKVFKAIPRTLVVGRI